MQNLNWPTVALVALTGGGNLFLSSQNTQQRQNDAYRAFQQISDLHESLDNFEKRQKSMLESMDKALANQTQMLKNQSEQLDLLHQQAKQQ